MRAGGDVRVRDEPGGFMCAACPAVITSLWRVQDESTAELMSDLYRRLLDGESKADKLTAFTEARRALRKKWPDPRNWAPFIFVGDPR
jgi:CHAT domain-containing protein